MRTYVAKAGEVEKKTIYATLAKPVGRGSFLLGRYAGLVTMPMTLALVAGSKKPAVLIAGSCQEEEQRSVFA